MMIIERVREDLGEGVYEIRCSCRCEDQPFFIRLDKETLTYNPKTGIVRCPRCGDSVKKETILLTIPNRKELSNEQL
jgi:hypothetical protein